MAQEYLLEPEGGYPVYFITGELSEMNEATRLSREELAQDRERVASFIITSNHLKRGQEAKFRPMRNFEVDERDTQDLMRVGLSSRFIKKEEEFMRGIGREYEFRVGEDAKFGVHWISVPDTDFYHGGLFPGVALWFSRTDGELFSSHTVISLNGYPDLSEEQIDTLEQCADRKVYQISTLQLNVFYS